MSIALYMDHHVPRAVTVELRLQRRGMEKGVKQGFRQSVLDVLTTRFAQVSQSLVTAVTGLDDESVLSWNV